MKTLALLGLLFLAGCGLLQGARDGASQNPPGTSAPKDEGGYGWGYTLGALAITALSLVTKGAVNAGVVKNLSNQLGASAPASLLEKKKDPPA